MFALAVSEMRYPGGTKNMLKSYNDRKQLGLISVFIGSPQMLRRRPNATSHSQS